MRARSRRYVATLSLLHYLALLVGIPLPLPAAKDSSRPFPCQHHRCGCQNAEQCWRQCCCFTNEQKLAWARKNGVTPPVELLADSIGSPDVDSRDAESHEDADAQEHDGHDQHAAAGNFHTRACCAHRERQQTEPKNGPTSHDRGQRSVVGFDAARCHGDSPLLVALNLLAAPLSALAWTDDCTPCEWLFLSDSKAFGITPSIEPPPPKA